MCIHQTSTWLLISSDLNHITRSPKKPRPLMFGEKTWPSSMHYSKKGHLTLKTNTTGTLSEHAGKQAGLFSLSPTNCLKQISKLLNNFIATFFFLFSLQYSALKSSSKLFHQCKSCKRTCTFMERKKNKKKTRDQIAVLKFLKLMASKVC